MKCITLTLNPAFDRHCHVPSFTLYHEHLATSDICEAGGKGVNISRAMSANGADNLALVVLGKENQAAFSAALDADGLNYISISVNGRVRENLTIHTDNAPETRISFSGFMCDDSLLDKVLGKISPLLDGDTVLTFTGRVPEGIGMSAVTDFLDKVRNTGAKIVIDSKSFTTLNALVEAKPWLIKPNQEEISEYLGCEIKTHEQTLKAAREIHAQGVENVMISLGEKGAMLVCEKGAFICTPPAIEAKSTIGAGDSSIGGFIAAILEGLDERGALCRSVAYGSAACMREGTLPPLPDDVAWVLRRIATEKID